MNDQISNFIRQGQEAAASGNREMARQYLQAAVDLDPSNATGWLWLAGTLDDPDDVRYALEQVLILDPGNIRAEQGLAELEARSSAPPTEAYEPVETDDFVEVEPQPEESSVAAPPIFFGTGTLGTPAPASGPLTLEEELRAQMQPQVINETRMLPGGATTVRIFDDTPAPTNNDLPFRMAAGALIFTFVVGLCIFGGMVAGFI